MRGRILQATLAAVIVAACQGQAPAQGGKGQGARPFMTAEVATFDSPWAMDFLPGRGIRLTNMALVSEKGGRLWLVDVATGRKQQVGGVPEVATGGQGGLGDVVLHPDFAGNGLIYLSYVEAGEGGKGAVLGVGELALSGAGAPRIVQMRVIWRQSPKVDGNGHFAHRIAFAPDGTIFLTSGERQKMEPAQDPNSDLGKIIHMTAEGQRINGHHYTMGHRNPLGIAFAPDGRLWSTEMGPKGGDELNLIVAGKNYGWPRASNGSHYDGREIPDHRPRDGFEAPKAWWNPSISPGGLIIYSGDKFPAWKGDALIPALSGEALIRVDINGDTARKADQWPMNARIRAVEQGPEGSVYLLEDEGRLLRLDPIGQSGKRR